MLNATQIKSSLKRALSGFHLVALITSLFLSPVAHALQIRLGSNMNLRVFKNEELAKIGMLAKGSVVEIPDKYTVRDRSGKISASASFNNWLSKAGYTSQEINKKVRDPKLDFYFPVKIVSMAPGSTGSRSLVGKTHFMALRVLAKSSGRLMVNRNSPVFKGPDDIEPLWPQDPEEESAAPTETATAPETSPALDPQTEAAGVCENCSNPDAPTPVSTEILAATSEALDVSAPSSFDDEFVQNRLPTLSSGFFSGGARCDRFIKADGSGYGPYGQELLRQISEPEMNRIYMSNGNGAVNACPNFASFTPAQKRHFWVWTFAALAWQESKCNNGTRDSSAHINPNGKAVGLYQIERRSDLREGRDDRYRGRYCSGDPESLRVNTRCSVRMLATPLTNGNGPLTRSNQYWGPFKFAENGEWIKLKNGRRIFVKSVSKKLIKQYAACFRGARS